MLTLTNQKRFNQVGYNNETIAYESNLEWHAISSTDRVEVVNEITNTNLILQD